MIEIALGVAGGICVVIFVTMLVYLGSGLVDRLIHWRF